MTPEELFALTVKTFIEILVGVNDSLALDERDLPHYWAQAEMISAFVGKKSIGEI